MDRLRVEAPDEESALALVHALRGHHAEIAPRPEGGCEIFVELDGNPERAVVEVLNTVDGWLAASGMDTTKVTLDGRSYTLTSKP